MSICTIIYFHEYIYKNANLTKLVFNQVNQLNPKRYCSSHSLTLTQGTLQANNTQIYLLTLDFPQPGHMRSSLKFSSRRICLIILYSAQWFGLEESHNIAK